MVAFFNLLQLISPLSVNHILLFLARPWLHAGSCDPLLYQHRARCTLGDSCLPFISPGYRDASLVCVLAACVYFSGHTGRSYFMGVWLSASRLCVCRCADVPAWMRICVNFGPGERVWAQGSGPKPLPGESGGLSLQRATGLAVPASPPRGKSCLYGEASLGTTGG